MCWIPHVDDHKGTLHANKWQNHIPSKSKFGLVISEFERSSHTGFFFVVGNKPFEAANQFVINRLFATTVIL